MHRNKAIIWIIAKKLFWFVLSLFALSIIVFFMARLAPGDAMRAYYGEGIERMSDAQRSAAASALGLDRPIWVQYGIWLSGVLRGNFGISLQYKQDVIRVIGGVWQNTLLLAGTAFLLTCFLSLAFGALCCYFEGKWLDRLICKVGIVSNCIPSFLLSLALILVFSIWLRLLPSTASSAGGIISPVHLILPICSLLIGHVWYYTYNVRNLFCEQVRQDYVLTCRAKGLTRMQTLVRHCLPNILSAYASMMAVFIPHILGGTYVVEKIFSYPGLGTLCLEAVQYHDYNMVMVICLFTGVAVILSGALARMIGQKTLEGQVEL